VYNSIETIPVVLTGDTRAVLPRQLDEYALLRTASAAVQIEKRGTNDNNTIHASIEKMVRIINALAHILKAYALIEVH